ncbi:MAG: GHMP kinase [Selenomonas ruminantium]|uniref:GHMP kinase n=1 Tax=Selenomonas ruminantium TaxID=971 RepID=A0A927WRV2_SELRU|nr:GHMP kinase [Selenomonas ruminantium]
MIVSKTPLRCSFFGGGTDFAGYYENSKYGYGTVLSTALNMYVYIMVCKRFDHKIRVCYRIQEMVDSVDEIQHNIVREAMKIVGITGGIDIVYSADIPMSTSGVGLASSSAFAVGVLNALFAYQGKRVSANDLAKLACEIEIVRLGNPIGIQDQYAVANGGFRQYKFWPTGEVTHTIITGGSSYLRELRRNLMLYYTGQTRISSNILSEQERNIQDKTPVLDKMVQMTETACTELGKGAIGRIGEMLDEAWQLKKQMASKISNPEIDRMYALAKENGALGGKILGAGGGGFMLLYVQPECQVKVKKAMQEYRQVEFDFEPEGSRIIFAE